MQTDLFRTQVQVPSAFDGPNSISEQPLAFPQQTGQINPISKALGDLIATAQPVLDFINRDRELDLQEKRITTAADVIANEKESMVPITSNIGVNANAVQINKGLLLVGALLAGGLAIVALRR